jgi:phospholipid-binding lipoprotein MlaA
VTALVTWAPPPRKIVLVTGLLVLCTIVAAASAGETSTSGPVAQMETPGPGAAEAAASAGEADEAAAEQAAAGARRNPDPWEPFNRAVFQLNEWGDIYFVKPMSQGWRFLTPSFFRDAVTNFNTNLQMPVIFANNALQLKPRNARDDALRFFFDMTFGLAGLIDVATYIDIPQNDEDFGQTLGYWGTPSGPYLVLPVYGPSNVRDGFGRLADSAGTLYFSFLPFYTTLLVSGVDVVNLRSFYIEEIDANRNESFDYYVFLRNAYMQNRRKKVASRSARGEDTRPDESLYELEEDYDEFFDEDFDDDLGAEEDDRG